MNPTCIVCNGFLGPYEANLCCQCKLYKEPDDVDYAIMVEYIRKAQDAGWRVFENDCSGSMECDDYWEIPSDYHSVPYSMKKGGGGSGYPSPKYEVPFEHLPPSSARLPIKLKPKPKPKVKPEAPSVEVETIQPVSRKFRIK